MSTPTLADLVLQAGPAIRRSVRVAVDVEVIAYYPSTQTADVRPCVPDDPRQTPDGSITAETPPVIYAVPVRWQEGGRRALRWGLEPGDRCEGLVRHRSHDQVDSGAAVPVDLLSLREFDLSDMVLYPGARPPTDELAAADYHPNGEVVLRLPTGEALHIGASTATLRLVLEDVLRPFLVDLRTWLLTHTHAGVTVGAGTTGIPTGAAPPSVPATGDLASGRIEVDT